MALPLVTAITPIYSGLPHGYLDEMASTLANNRTPIEVILVSDADTLAWATPIAARHLPTLAVVEESNNVGHRRNLALQRARGDYAGAFDADDMHLPGGVDHLVEYLQQHPRYTAIFSRPVHTDEKGYGVTVTDEPSDRSWTHSELRAFREHRREGWSKWGNYPMLPSSGIWRTDVLQAGPGWDERCEGNKFEDIPPIAHAAAVGPVRTTSRITMKHRFHADALGTRIPPGDEVIEIIKDVEKLEKGPRFPYALTEN